MKAQTKVGKTPSSRPRAKVGGKPARTTPAGKGAAPAGKKLSKPEWSLRLYVAGQTPKSLAAFANLKRICEQHLANRYAIEVIDLSKQPHLAQSDQIVALPTLVRKLPEPIKRILGDLSNVERVMVGMEVHGKS